MSRFSFTIVNNTITGVTDSGSGTNEAIIPDSVTAILKSGEGVFQSNSNLHAFTCSSSSLLNSIGSKDEIIKYISNEKYGINLKKIGGKTAEKIYGYLF
jgi:hypothetical protein